MLMQEQNEPEAVITPEPTPNPPSAAPQQPQPYAAPEQQPQLPQPLTPQQPFGAPPAPTVTPQSSPQTTPLAYDEPQQAFVATSPDQKTSALQAEPLEQDDDILLTWQSSESDENAKNAGYYVAVVAVAIVLTAIVFWVTEQDFLASGAVFLAVLGFAYLAIHKPGQQDYALAGHGIYIGNKLRAYDEFKNFSVNEDGSATNIMLVPHKRFGSPLILRLANEQKDDVIHTLSQFLPVVQRKLDAVDQLMRRMHL